MIAARYRVAGICIVRKQRERLSDNPAQYPGAHAAAFSALIPVSHRLDVWLGDATVSDCSFPLTDGGDLPAAR